MSVNKRLAWGVALMLLSPLVSMVSLSWSCLAGVFGALLLITPYLSGSKSSEIAYRWVDKGMAVAVGLYCLLDIIFMFFLGDPWYEGFASLSLIRLWAVWIAFKVCGLIWMYGLWCLRRQAVLLGVLGMIALMAVPNPSPDCIGLPSEQREQNTVDSVGYQEKDPGLLDLTADDADDYDQEESPSLPDSPDKRVYTTSAITVEIPFRGYFTLLVAYSFMRLGSLRRKCEAGEPETAAA